MKQHFSALFFSSLHLFGILAASCELNCVNAGCVSVPINKFSSILVSGITGICAGVLMNKSLLKAFYFEKLNDDLFDFDRGSSCKKIR